MLLQIGKVPLTCYGSFYAIQHFVAEDGQAEGLYVKTMHKGVAQHRVVLIECLHAGVQVPVEYSCTPVSLKISTSGGWAELCFRDEETVSFQARGIELQFTFVKPSHMVVRPDGRGEVNLHQQRCKAQLSVNQGKLVPQMDWDGDNATRVQFHCAPITAEEPCEGELILFQNQSCAVDRKSQPYTASVAAAKRRYEQWAAHSPVLPEQYREAGELADYLNWASFVRPEGLLTRYSMYCSLNWMLGVWTWDHCFHGMAALYHDPSLAWDQWMIAFEQQDRYGALPDQFNDHDKHYAFTKPPVHGWALRWMMERTAWIQEEQVLEAYEPLTRWTQWWFTHRDDNGNGIPEYHNGNDCGWDNSTVFYQGVPLESPDLCTYLIIQMEVLSDIAATIGDNEGSGYWAGRASELLERMLERFWTGERFVARLTQTEEPVESESLLMFVPLLLGKRLPEEVRKTLVRELTQEGRFITRFGLASEALFSPHYQEDGYWRGPIWAPAMMLLCEGLKQSGELELSRELARRFCDAAAQNGYAENFHAETGSSLRDPTIIWTSSVFMVLAHEYV